MTSLGIDLDRPSVVFVGRITRQKGLIHLVRAAEQFDPDTQLVLLAGAPDTPEIAAEFDEAFAHLKAKRGNVIWIQEMLPRASVRQVLSHATVFACPSVYEPLGIVNLEAMACETAVVASAVGGIPEVVVDGETGYLVPYDPAQAGDPAVRRRVRGRHRDQDQLADRRPGQGRAVRPGRSAALHRRVQLGQDRRRDRRRLPHARSRSTLLIMTAAALPGSADAAGQQSAALVDWCGLRSVAAAVGAGPAPRRRAGGGAGGGPAGVPAGGDRGRARSARRVDRSSRSGAVAVIGDRRGVFRHERCWSALGIDERCEFDAAERLSERPSSSDRSERWGLVARARPARTWSWSMTAGHRVDHAGRRAPRVRAGAAAIIVAVPVGAEEAVTDLERVADAVVCPARPVPFVAVGQAYADFTQVSRREMLRVLAAQAR